MGVCFVRKGSRKPERQNGSTWPNTCTAALSFWIVTGTNVDRGYVHRSVTEFSNWLDCGPMSCGG